MISYHIKGKNKNFVITNDEKMIDLARVEYQYKIVCSQYDFKINFHALRHTFATNCVKSEIDIKTISEMLGHSNVSITLNRYVHSNLEFQKKQMKKIKNPFTCKI